MANSKESFILSESKPGHTWATRRDIVIVVLGWMLFLFSSFWLLGHVGRSLILLALAALLAYALVPAVRFLERFMPHLLAILLVYLVVLSGLGVVVYLVITTAVSQFSLLANNLDIWLRPEASSGESPLIVTMHRFGLSSDQISQIGNELTAQIEAAARSIVPILSSLLSFIFDTLLVAVLSIYLLVDGTKTLTYLKNNVPNSQMTRVKFLFNTVEKVVGGYIRGQLLLSTIVGLLIGSGMYLFHVPYAVLLGLLAFILAFIPILGTLISGFICVLLALTQGWLIAFFVLIYFVFAHIIEGDILGPRIVGRAVGIHPLVSLVALMVGSELFGIVGALFASPVAGIGQAVFKTFWTEWKATHADAFVKGKETLEKEIQENLADKPV